jgi:hypothetical protein
MICANSIRGWDKEQQKAAAEVSTMPTKQQTVATELESMQTEKEDTTQLYIGPNTIVKGSFFCSLGGSIISWFIRS